MNETTTEKRTFFAAVLTVICIFCFGQCPGSIAADTDTVDSAQRQQHRKTVAEIGKRTA